MKQAFELFSSKSYLKAEKLFLQAEETEALEAKKYLFLISKALNKSDLPRRFNAYLSELAKTQRQKEFLIFVEENQIELEPGNWEFWLDSLWAAGKVEAFNLSLKKVWAKIIEKKIYCRSEEIFQKTRRKNPYLLINYFSYLTYLAETNQNLVAAKLSSELRSLLEKKWEKFKSCEKSQLQCFEKLLSIMESLQLKDLLLEQEIFQTRRVIAAKSGKKMSNRLLIEYIILFKSNLEALALLIASDTIEGKEKFAKVLAETESLEKEINKAPMRLRQLIRPSPNFNLRKTFSEEKEIERGLEKAIPEGVRKIQAAAPRDEKVSGGASTKFLRYDLGANEREILVKIKNRDPAFRAAGSDLPHSLMGIGFFKAALELLNQSKKDPRFYYLRCHALFELGEFQELIDYAHFIFASGLSEEEKPPFLYIQGLACLQLKQNKRALSCFETVMKSDPNFRNIRELLARAKA